MIRVGDVVLRADGARSKSWRWRSARPPCCGGSASSRLARGSSRNCSRSTGCTCRASPPARCCSTRRASSSSSWTRDRREPALAATRPGRRARRAGLAAPRRRGPPRARAAAPAPLSADAADEPAAHRGVPRGARAGHPRRALRRRPRRHHDVLDPRRRPRLRADLGARRRDGDADPLPRDRRAARGRHRAGPRRSHPRALRRPHGVRDDGGPGRREPRARRPPSSPASPSALDLAGVPRVDQRAARRGRRLVARDRRAVQARRARPAGCSPPRSAPTSWPARWRARTGRPRRAEPSCRRSRSGAARCS